MIMKTISKVLMICLLFAANAGFVLSQNIDKPQGRYIIVEAPDQIFSEVDGNFEVRNFLVYGFSEETSSKPFHENINEMQGIVKFSIASRSEAVQGARRCTAIMTSDKYQETFRKVLLMLEVQTVVVGNDHYTVDEFYQIIKQK